MSQNDLTFLPLRVTHVGAGGKRSFDPVDKQRLVDACLQPGASLSGLALKAGVNANQLGKWVRLRERSASPMPGNVACAATAFVPVVAIDDAMPTRAPVPDAQSLLALPPVRVSPRSTASARLSAELPNGVKLELECGADDSALVRAMIAALGAC
jgi:transposase